MIILCDNLVYQSEAAVLEESQSVTSESELGFDLSFPKQQAELCYISPESSSSSFVLILTMH